MAQRLPKGGEERAERAPPFSLVNTHKYKVQSKQILLQSNYQRATILWSAGLLSRLHTAAGRGSRQGLTFSRYRISFCLRNTKSCASAGGTNDTSSFPSNQEQLHSGSSMTTIRARNSTPYDTQSAHESCKFWRISKMNTPTHTRNTARAHVGTTPYSWSELRYSRAITGSRPPI